MECVEALINASRSNPIEKIADQECKLFGVHGALKGVNHRIRPLRSPLTLDQELLFSRYRMANDNQSVLWSGFQASAEVSAPIRDVDITTNRFEEHASAFEQVGVLAVAKNFGPRKDRS